MKFMDVQAAGGTLQFISDGDPAAAEAFLQGGGRWVQLRMKDTPAEGIIARGREILALCRRYDALLIVNDDPLLAKVICRLPGSIFRCRGVNSSSW